MNEEKSTRYHRQRRRTAALSLTLSAVLLLGLLGTNGSRTVREVAQTLVARLGVPPLIDSFALVAAYVAILIVIHELLTLPPRFYLGVLDRRYGLSTAPSGRWLEDHVKATLVACLVGAPAVMVVYGTIRIWPAWWWLVAGLVGSLAAMGLAKLTPVLLFPLCVRRAPIDRPALRQKLEALARRAGTNALGVYECRFGSGTRRASAALVGLGRTRSILLSDTLANEYTDDEIEVVLAHELAHHVHGDLWTGLAYDMLRLLVGFLVAARAWPTLASAAQVVAIDDVAGLPILLLTVGVVWSVGTPLANVLSRHHERRADRDALELTRNPAAFVSAMRRLGAQNLAEHRPSRLTELLFYTHPPFHQRITSAQRLAQAWAQPS